MAYNLIEKLGFGFRLSGKTALLCVLSLIMLFIIPNVESQTNRVNYRLANLQNRACSMGRLQSPIHLTTLNSTYNDSIFLASDSYLTITDAVLRYDGRLLEIASLGAVNGMNRNLGYVLLKKEGVVSKYDLRKVNIHTPAEHYIDGVRYELEIQFIHEKDLDFTSAVNDFKNPSDVNLFFVVSILFSTTGPYVDNNFINRLFDYYNTDVTNQTTLNLELEETRLFRNRRFFFYEGSETVDPCDETHLYYVVADIFRVDPNVLQRFRDVYSTYYNNSDYNKPVSEYYGREIVRNFYTEQDSSFKTSLNWALLALALLILV